MQLHAPWTPYIRSNYSSIEAPARTYKRSTEPMTTLATAQMGIKIFPSIYNSRPSWSSSPSIFILFLLILVFKILFYFIFYLNLSSHLGYLFFQQERILIPNSKKSSFLKLIERILYVRRNYHSINPYRNRNIFLLLLTPTNQLNQP